MRKFLDSSPLRATTDLRATKETARRHNDRAQLTSPSVADFVRDRLRSHSSHGSLREALGSPPAVEVEVSDNIRLYRYEPGMRFGPHYDESSDTPRGRTRWTVLVYFSEVERGGATNFYPGGGGGGGEEPVSVEPEEGKALFHLHGDHCLLHEGAEVIRGTKYVLRTDLCF